MLYNTVKQFRTLISEKLASFSFTVEKEHITLPFLMHSATWKNYALHFVEWIQEATEETRKKKIPFKLVGTELENLNVRQEVQSKQSNLLCLKAGQFDPSRVHLYTIAF